MSLGNGGVIDSKKAFCCEYQSSCVLNKVSDGVLALESSGNGSKLVNNDAAFRSSREERNSDRPLVTFSHSLPVSEGNIGVGIERKSFVVLSSIMGRNPSSFAGK